ncbi:MAG TPA: transporter associated domain-containing protein, partial [Longimicrobiales bacterium]|nr:transporter associated domain-containing protein [Longimicrobiales bacterium]
PVYEQTVDRVVGMIHAKDLAMARFSGADEGTVADLVRPILAVHERLSADRVLSLMREQSGVMAVVVDDFGGTSGIITAEDILTELLGEVGDEFKHDAGPPQRLPDGRIRLPGDLPLFETRQWIGASWEGDSDTVGGLVTERLGRIPEPGDRLDIDGALVEVEGVEHRAVTRLLVTPQPEPDESEEEGT